MVSKDGLIRLDSIKKASTLPPMGCQIMWLPWGGGPKRHIPLEIKVESFLSPCCYLQDDLREMIRTMLLLHGLESNL